MDHDILFFFTADYDYRPSYDPGMIIAYRAGTECEVTEECASRAATSGFGTFAAVAEDDLFDIADDGEGEA